MSTPALPHSIDDTLARLAALDYVADHSLATCVFLALKLQRPLFLEGEPGTGKTEIARTLAAMLERPLIRLQCYEGLALARLRGGEAVQLLAQAQLTAATAAP